MVTSWQAEGLFVFVRYDVKARETSVYIFASLALSMVLLKVNMRVTRWKEIKKD